MIKSSDKLVLKKAVKKRDRMMTMWDKGKFWTKIWDIPLKVRQLDCMRDILSY